MQMSNTEMGYQMWIEYLIKITCAIYQMDPSEINFDLRGSQGQQPVFMSNNEAQQKMSKDRGLRPLLSFLQDCLNDNILEYVDEEYELAFVGLDAKSEEQAIELRTKQGQTMLTINEVRALDDLDPIEAGDIILNPAYTSYLMQQAAQQQQQAMAGAQGGGGQPGAPAPGGDGSESQPPQMPGAQQPMQQPFAGAMGEAGDKPSQGGQQASQAMQAFAKQGRGDDNPDVHKEADYMRILRRNDWQESVHASVRGDDLKKGFIEDLATFFDIDV
jgi:hypothetical protein